jgi:carbonic anhydrase
VPLIMVLGHTSCGAVTAALEGATPPGALWKLLDEIRNICGGADESATEGVDAVVRRYTLHIADSLRTTGPVLQGAVERGECAVVPACYSLTEGIIELLEPHTAIP